jgi:glycosyltransferase involved in cell wall biosynthesis
MSVFNGAEYLEECITSILEQSYTNFEFIITNDCSNDDSLQILNRYKEKDNRIIIIDNQENLGLTKNLNNMISISKGDFIARMDADDIALKDRFRKQLEVFKNNRNVDLVFTDNFIINHASEAVCSSWRPKETTKIIKYLPVFNYIVHPSVMIRKDFFEQFGMYDENYQTGQDHNLWLRASQKGATFYYLREPLLNYRINPSSVRNKNNDNYYFKLAKVCLANNSKRRSFKYLTYLNLRKRINILIRSLFPFFIYRHILYMNNLRCKH